MEKEATMNIVHRAMPRLVERALDPNLSRGWGLIWYRWKMADARFYTFPAGAPGAKKIH